MAIETVPGARGSLPINAIDSISEADLRLTLVQWIERARFVIDELQATADRAPGFRAALKEQHIPYVLQWDQGASEGLSYLHNDIAALLSKVQTQPEVCRHAQ